MKVLVACEESQAVCKAFRELGHEAYSCDIQECSGGHPEWHIQGDALVDKLETENYRLRGMAHRCIDCAHWKRDTDPETGAEVHVCYNAASPRLDDLTEGSDHCGYWQADA